MAENVKARFLFFPTLLCCFTAGHLETPQDHGGSGNSLHDSFGSALRASAQDVSPTHVSGKGKFMQEANAKQREPEV